MKFWKYHGCGNDFIILKYQEDVDYSVLAMKLCPRRISVGADGLIVVKEKPLEMIFYNADGSRGTMCGNGIRCFTAFCYDEKINVEKNFNIQTLAGLLNTQIMDVELMNIKVNMGYPKYSNELTKVNSQIIPYFNQTIKIEDNYLKVNTLFMTTVHTVIFVEDINEIIKTDIGEQVCNNKLFREKTNVNFVQIVDENNFIVRTYERGAGWTLACGSGACASFVVGKIFRKCGKSVNIHFEKGSLFIYEEGNDIIMEGPTKRVYCGEI